MRIIREGQEDVLLIPATPRAIHAQYLLDGPVPIIEESHPGELAEAYRGEGLTPMSGISVRFGQTVGTARRLLERERGVPLEEGVLFGPRITSVGSLACSEQAKVFRGLGVWSPGSI